MDCNVFDMFIVLLLGYLLYNYFVYEKFTVMEQPSLTLYYAPWCGHCETMLKNGWKNMPEIYKGVKINKIDCTKKENKVLVENLKDNNGNNLIKGFPTVLLKKDSKKHLEYSGNRTTED